MCVRTLANLFKDEKASDQDFEPTAKKRKKSGKAAVKRVSKKKKKKAGLWLTMLPVDVMMLVAEHLPPDALFSLCYTSKVCILFSYPCRLCTMP
jgi:hypothetical protein